MSGTQDPSVIEFSISRTIDDIADSSCDYCGGAEQKTYSEGRFEYEQNGKSFVAVCKVPGYYCPKCDLHSSETQASVDATRAVLPIVQAAGDEFAIKLYREMVWAGEEHLARWKMQLSEEGQ